MEKWDLLPLSFSFVSWPSACRRGPHQLVQKSGRGAAADPGWSSDHRGRGVGEGVGPGDTVVGLSPDLPTAPSIPSLLPGPGPQGPPQDVSPPVIPGAVSALAPHPHPASVRRWAQPRPVSPALVTRWVGLRLPSILLTSYLRPSRVPRARGLERQGCPGWAGSEEPRTCCTEAPTSPPTGRGRRYGVWSLRRRLGRMDGPPGHWSSVPSSDPVIGVWGPSLGL